MASDRCQVNDGSFNHALANHHLPPRQGGSITGAAFLRLR